MVRAGASNLHVEPERTVMTGTQQIPILKVCDLDDSKLKKILLDKTLSQVYSIDGSEYESVTVDGSSLEESESENVQKSINRNKEKYAIDETQHEEPSVIYNPVINEPSYFNIFECGKNILNRIYATCEQACMENSTDT